MISIVTDKAELQIFIKSESCDCYHYVTMIFLLIDIYLYKVEKILFQGSGADFPNYAPFSIFNPVLRCVQNGQMYKQKFYRGKVKRSDNLTAYKNMNKAFSSIVIHLI